MTNKEKTGIIMGIASMLTMLISITIFLFRGPNADMHIDAAIFITLALIGILLAIFSWIKSRLLAFLILGLLGNVVVMAFGILLLIAVGISG
jgi:hypothetical protein